MRAMRAQDAVLGVYIIDYSTKMELLSESACAVNKFVAIAILRGTTNYKMACFRKCVEL